MKTIVNIGVCLNKICAIYWLVKELQTSQERLFSVEWGSCLLIWRYAVTDCRLCFLMVTFCVGTMLKWGVFLMFRRHVLHIFSGMRKWELRYSPVPCSAKAEEQNQLCACCRQHECEFWPRHYCSYYTKKNLRKVCKH